MLPLSARKGDRFEELARVLVENLPEGEPLFEEDELTDQPLRVLVAEMVREKILRATGEEIPYVTAVVTERYEEVSEELSRIYCAVYVERPSQKSIIIGKGGARLKEVGTAAREDIERLVGHKVFLQLFVKVEENWRDSPQALSEMGIEERKGRKS